MENQNIHEQEKLFFLYSGAKITEKLDKSLDNSGELIFIRFTC